MREEKVLWEPRRAVPIDARADVCVCGGGCTGVFAAVRAARLGSAVRSFCAKKPIFWTARRCGHFCERAVRLCKHTSTRERTQKVYGNNDNNFEKTCFFV